MTTLPVLSCGVQARLIYGDGGGESQVIGSYLPEGTVPEECKHKGTVCKAEFGGYSGSAMTPAQGNVEAAVAFGAREIQAAYPQGQLCGASSSSADGCIELKIEPVHEGGRDSYRAVAKTRIALPLGGSADISAVKSRDAETNFAR